MSFFLTLLWFLASLVAGHVTVQKNADEFLLRADQDGVLEACGVTSAVFDEYLNMDQAKFDSQPGQGWRAVAAQDGCRLAAQILIEQYILFSPKLRTEKIVSLRWHAGQLAAFDGRLEPALLFMKASYKEAGPYYEEWNIYVSATIAFLERDRSTLDLWLSELTSRSPSPEQVAASRQAFEKDPKLQEVFPDWERDILKAPNTKVVQRLVDCYARPYVEAYSGCQE